MSSFNETRGISFDNSGVINPWVSEFFSTFNLIIIAELIGCFGIVGNVINIWNFAKQGLKDSVNVTLAALALSDIGALVTQMFTNVLFSPFWKRVDLPFASSSTLAMIFYYPHCYFIRVSGLITVFASFERCLCVVLPLRVKRIITRNVALVTSFALFVILQSYFFPIYCVSYLALTFVPQKNRTMIYLFYKNNADYVLKVSYFVADMATPYITFTLLTVFTSVIIIKLKTNSHWRRTATGKTLNIIQKKNFISKKERKLVVMLTTVSVIFIICLMPNCALMTAIGVVRELKVDGPYYDLTMLIYDFTSILETINCSFTIIIYYTMSTKYREIIHAHFRYPSV
ncbi:FMRFamide receptor [Biomphalaria glabrata]|nr:FMRFamide receptor-like [Biomphalaria glabrata]